MSSSIDYFDCPRCGGSAFREQDNRTCEITYGCSNCSWKGEPVENNIKKYQKVTIGFVVQHYKLNKEGKYACSWQSFEAGEQVTREDDNGELLKIDTSKEVEQVMDMEQPDSQTFDEWYQDNKKNDSVQRYYRGVVENDPDYPFCFKDWCRKYYKECVDMS